jgi:hypothetical protein
MESSISIEAFGIFSAKASGNFAIVALCAVLLAFLVATTSRRPRETMAIGLYIMRRARALLAFVSHRSLR